MNSLLRRVEEKTCSCEQGLDYDCDFQADSDIAGIGVILSFVIVVVLTYGIVLYTYCFRPSIYGPNALNRLDELVGFTVRSSCLWVNDILHLKRPSAKHFQGYEIREANVEDSTQIRTTGRSFSAATRATDEALFKILLALSDQQLFTGVAILTLAYIQMETIVTYHAAIIECMATLAFVVYDCTSTLMFHHLRKPENFFMMTWRAVFILSFMVLLFVTQLPLGNEYWLESYGVPFVCFWRDLKGNYDLYEDPNLTDMVMSMAWMALGIRSTLCNYFPRALSRVFDNAVTRYLESGLVKVLLAPRRLSSHSLKESRATGAKAAQAAFKVGAAISFFFAALLFILAEVASSVAFSLQGNWFLMLNSICWAFYLRSQASDEGRVGDEDKWGFGQAVPLFILGIPFFALAEAIYDAYRVGRAQLTEAPAHGYSMQELLSPSYAGSVTEEPRPVNGSNVAISTHSSGSQVAAPSSLRRSRTLPDQRRLDTEEGGRAIDRDGPADTTSPMRRMTSSTSRREMYYFGYGVGVEEGGERWEDRLYQFWAFKGLLLLLLLTWMAYWTYVAVWWLPYV